MGKDYNNLCFVSVEEWYKFANTIVDGQQIFVLLLSWSPPGAVGKTEIWDEYMRH